MEHLIPAHWFHGLSQLALLAIAAASIAVLGKGADWLVEGAAGLARRAGISKLIVGATVVSLGTTSPECAVSVMAAFSGEPGLALGNAVGSIIADTGLIFGLGCVLAYLPADRFVLTRQGWVQFGSGVLLALICYGLWIVQGDEAVIGRPFGLLLLAILVWYMWISVRWSRERARERHEEDEPSEPIAPTMKLIGLIALGLPLIILSSHVLILNVTELATVHWKVPTVVIASTVVALGTSLPELVIGMTSIRRGHPEILVGNVVGADVLNVLFVVGASAFAAPLPIMAEGSRRPDILMVAHLPAMLLILGLFRVYVYFSVREGTFRRWHGIPLLVIYVVYSLIQYRIT